MQRLGRKVRHDAREERRLEQAREPMVDGTGVVRRRIGRAHGGDRAVDVAARRVWRASRRPRLTRFDMGRR